MTSVCFSVDGLSISRLARDFVREGNWIRGIETIKEALIGIDSDLAISVIKGEAEILGNSSDEEGVYVDTDGDDTVKIDMANVLSYLYSKTFYYRNKYWVPYAEVTSLGQIDTDWIEDRPDSAFRLVTDDEFEDTGKLDFRRAFMYANSPFTDLAVLVPDTDYSSKKVIICKQGDAPPPWMKKYLEVDPVEFLTELVENGASFEERGAYVETVREAQIEIQPVIDELPQNSEDEFTMAQANAMMAQLSMETMQRYSMATSSEEMTQIEADMLDKRNRIQAKLAGVRDDDEQSYSEYLANRDQTTKFVNQFIRNKINDKARVSGGFITLTIADWNGEEEHSIDVPAFPFYAWALGLANAKRMVPDFEWTPVSSSGMKMQCDNPYHTDWIIGAGVDAEDAYSSDPESLAKKVMAAAYDMQFDLRHQFMDESFIILARGSKSIIEGKGYLVKENEVAPEGCIPIAPHAGPEYQLAMMAAGAIICETGGKLAHLAVVGRESSCSVFMCKNGIQKYNGYRIRIDMTASRQVVSVLSNLVDF